MKDLLEISQWLEASAVELQILERRIGTRTPEGWTGRTMLAAFAQFERNLIVGRAEDGLADARARGGAGARWPKFVQHIVDRRDDGEWVAALVSYFDVSRQTVYRALEGGESG
jgi:DNA invertase Pin-like site-specific DNA recombinase